MRSYFGTVGYILTNLNATKIKNTEKRTMPMLDLILTQSTPGKLPDQVELKLTTHVFCKRIPTHIVNIIFDNNVNIILLRPRRLKSRLIFETSKNET